MSFILYYVISLVIMWFCAKQNIGLPDDNTMLILAILAAGEVISWRCSK